MFNKIILANEKAAKVIKDNKAAQLLISFKKYDLMNIEELKIEFDNLYQISSIGRDIESLKAFNYVSHLLSCKFDN